MVQDGYHKPLAPDLLRYLADKWLHTNPVPQKNTLFFDTLIEVGSQYIWIGNYSGFVESHVLYLIPVVFGLQIELLVSTWCKQLEKILAESERMRREADDTGPRAELDYWRQMSSRWEWSHCSQQSSKHNNHNCRVQVQNQLFSIYWLIKLWGLVRTVLHGNQFVRNIIAYFV